MPENTPTAKDARSARRWCCCVLLAILWCASLPLACLPGPVPVAVADVWQALGAVVGLCPPADGSVQLVVGQIRLARVLLGLLCGGALAVAGVALQGVLRNPLADPFTLGISAGAACGASMAIALGGNLGIWAGGLAVGLSAAATVHGRYSGSAPGFRPSRCQWHMKEAGMRALRRRVRSRFSRDSLLTPAGSGDHGRATLGRELRLVNV